MVKLQISWTNPFFHGRIPPTFWVNCKTARDHWGNDMTDLVLTVVIDPVKVSDEILYMTWFSAIEHQTG